MTELQAAGPQHDTKRLLLKAYRIHITIMNKIC